MRLLGHLHWIVEHLDEVGHILCGGVGFSGSVGISYEADRLEPINNTKLGCQTNRPEIVDYTAGCKFYRGNSSANAFNNASATIRFPPSLK